MSLYIRLACNFWTNRKTMRLVLKLGNDALWILPKLWSYAATNQPDGNFRGYSDQEIAAVIGYTGDAEKLCAALTESGFLTEGHKLHDWDTHNGYHEAFANRARTAAEARWANHRKKEKEETGKERKGDKHCIKQCSSNAQASVTGSKPTSKPAISDCEQYAIIIGMPSSEGQKFFDHFESNGWRVGGKAAMKSWQAALRNWHRNWLERNPAKAEAGRAF